MKPIPLTLQTVFAELCQQVSTSARGGSPYERARDGIIYRYAKVPVGAGRIDVFLGRADDAEASARAESLRKALDAARERRKLVRLLIDGGLAAPHRTMGATLDAIAHAGLFEAGAVLVGTSAYLVSGPLVGHFLPSPTLATNDLDIATADLALEADPPDNMLAILKRGDPAFEPVMQVDPRKPASRFKTANAFLFDLITTVRRKTDGNPLPMEGLGAGAAPLQHIDWLIEDPVTTVALWGSGVPVKVPQPARFAVHKLIVAQKRDAVERLKRRKDLDQADAMIEALLNADPFSLEDAFQDARDRGSQGWAKPIDRSLAEIRREREGLSKVAAG